MNNSTSHVFYEAILRSTEYHIAVQGQATYL